MMEGSTAQSIIEGGKEMAEQRLVDLLKELEQEMVRLKYTENTLKLYRRRWRMLLEFADTKGVEVYSEPLGFDFLEHHFDLICKSNERDLKTSEVQELRIIRMIGDFQLHRTILRRYYKFSPVLTAPEWMALSQGFLHYCQEKDYSKVTMEHYTKKADCFMEFLASQGITQCEGIQMVHVHQYIRTLVGYAYKTVEQQICALRAFLRFLYGTQQIKEDFAERMPMIPVRKQTRIPSVWTADELKRLLEAIDRGNPSGKRDYAIILLACCLGLRVKDIKELKMNHFHWETKQLVFTQSKTRKETSLPLPPEVGWAVIDYLKYGRPDVDSPFVFLRHMAPIVPFSEADHLSQMITSYMRKAHLPTLKKQRGMHSLRHTLASMMLEKETPLSVISDVLGHTDPDSTKVYLKSSQEKLRICSMEEVRADA
jgi:integrase/recombinase XerD